MSTQVLASAAFDLKVKNYWMTLGVLCCLLSFVAIPLIPFILIIIWLLGGKVLSAMSAKLLPRKLIVKRGVIFKEEKSIPLDKVTDVGLSQGPLMRLFGLYRLSFETAGQSGNGALVSLLGVVNASDFREAVLAQKELINNTHETQNKGEDQSQLELIRALTYSVKNIEQTLITLLDNKDSR
ncbi:PH domain-containing protein [Pseudoalteromonas sp. MMG010]|uniref:PH domain-containing protein n=1 Tax=Pseudoalteromonas sp. MMG010 TaxID=2822685 RepID=UPI001B3A6CFB|nr:PH domain-containing protein [Pseudoalteromonas sp. MMG010]MBQ4834354.1 PH domain-containing protein [Pseudoalteromonas sp. MMG010]